LGKEAYEANVTDDPHNQDNLCNIKNNPYACSFTKAMEELKSSAMSGHGEKIVALCDSDANPFVCKFINDAESGCAKKKANSCNWMASISFARAHNEEEASAQWRKYVALACDYGDPKACENIKQVNDENGRIELVSKVHKEVKCGMSGIDIAAKLGPSESFLTCTDNIFSATRYGRRWIIYKGDGAFAIVDQKDFKTPCWDNWNNNVSFWNLANLGGTWTSFGTQAGQDLGGMMDTFWEHGGQG
jgi:hypothetical protein